MTSHGPIEPEVRATMKGMAEAIASALPPGYGFALLVFEFGHQPNGRMNYISNGTREDMLVALKEFIAHAEGRALEAGHA